MAAEYPVIVIADVSQVVPENTFVVRRIAPNQFRIEENGVSMSLEGSSLAVEVPLSDTLEGSASLGRMKVRKYRLVTRLGYWVEVSVSKGALIAQYVAKSQQTE